MKPGRHSTSLRAEFIDRTGATMFSRRLTLLYDKSLPYEVWIDIAGTPSGMVIHRNILLAGTFHPAGLGDILIDPWKDDPGLVVVTLRSGGETVRFLIPTQAVRNFVNRTYTIVPDRKERDHLDVDGWIDQLLAGTA